MKAKMPTARSGGGWATYNGRICVSGGELQNERLHATFRALEAYEPATNRWIILPSMRALCMAMPPPSSATGSIR